MHPRRAYLLTLAAGWCVLGAAGWWYARAKSIPLGLAAPLLIAFLTEFPFYLVAGFRGLHDELKSRLPVTALAGLIAVSGLIPYLIYSLGTHTFQPLLFVRLAVLLLFLAYWFVFREPSAVTDFAFLAVVAATLVTRFFTRVYPMPAPGLHVEVLGQLALIHTTALVLLLIRELDRVGFGFLPSRREWLIGAKHFAFLLPVALPLAVGLGAVRFDPNWREARLAPLVFAGFLWVRGLSEEMLARGFLQQRLEELTGKPEAALVLASVIFGAAHLGFGVFPNWRFAVVSAVAGWFYGRAYREGEGIRAAMVAHALTVTTWRTLFS